jgi:hypothetical protein
MIDTCGLDTINDYRRKRVQIKADVIAPVKRVGLVNALEHFAFEQSDKQILVFVGTIFVVLRSHLFLFIPHLKEVLRLDYSGDVINIHH